MYDPTDSQASATTHELNLNIEKISLPIKFFVASVNKYIKEVTASNINEVLETLCQKS